MGDEHTLEFLLAFGGRVHWLEEGYWIKFAIRRIAPSDQRAHGLRYALTLHAPDGTRLLGFDNAHQVRTSQGRTLVADHWHRTENDEGRPYEFRDADTLLADFFREVRRILDERGISDAVTRVEEKGDDS